MEQGKAYDLAPGLRAVLAPNPSPMTYQGTVTHIVGAGPDVAVIDPGPAIAGHIKAILRALGPGQQVRAILVTHAHLDHSPGAAPLAAQTGAPVYAFGRATAGRSAGMQRLGAQADLAGGEGVDHSFAPDIALPDGGVVSGTGWTLGALWTPGHMGNHLSFHWQEGAAVFCGDVVMGWASSLISPPDGDLAQFYTSLDRLGRVGARRFYPAHGDPIENPSDRLAFLQAHRVARTKALQAALSDQPQTIAALTAQVYPDLAPALHPAAARNLLAHLIWLYDRGGVQADPHLAWSARYFVRRSGGG